ncbi:MAG: hypothetical protein GY859_41510, partial [Desulfobacterales bacterium]|nr:hypothetical protein [Desulfobacterales bacterium]
IVVNNIKNLRLSGGEDHQTGRARGFQLQKRYTFDTPGIHADITRLPREAKVHASIFTRFAFSESLASRVDALVRLDVKESRLTTVRLRIPPGLDIRAVHAEDAADYIFEKESGILLLPFTRAIRGEHHLRLTLESEPGKAAPDSGFAGDPGDEGRAGIAGIAGLELMDVQRVEGRCLTLFPRGFDIREREISGMRSMDARKVSDPFRSVAGETAPRGARYAYAMKGEPFRALYEVSRKAPEFDVVKVYHARVEDALVHARVLCLLTIKNAPLDQIRLQAPAALMDSLEITGERVINVLKKRDETGRHVHVAVQVAGGAEGSYLMDVSFQKRLGNDRGFETPRVLFPGAAGRTEFITVETDTVYQVEARPSENLREIEPRMAPALPQGVDLNNVLWAYRAGGSGDWQCELRLKRLKSQKLIQANLLRNDIRTLITPGGRALHRVDVKATNRVLQFLPADLPPGAELWSLKVAGEPARASIGETSGKNQRLLIPLIKTGSGDRRFDITLVFMTPIPRFGLMDDVLLPMISLGDLPVEKTTWTIFAPRGYAYPEFDHNMEEIDVAQIEAEKTLELAREYEYWTKTARTAGGSLKQKAVDNRLKVMNEYKSQQALNQRTQMDLNQRAGVEQSEGQGVSLRRAQTKSRVMLDEALNIISTNQRVAPSEKEPGDRAEKPAPSKMKSIQGWQFNVDDAGERDQVRQSVDSFLQSEEDKETLARENEAPQKKRAEKKKEKLNRIKREVRPGKKIAAPYPDAAPLMDARAPSPVEVEEEVLAPPPDFPDEDKGQYEPQITAPSASLTDEPRRQIRHVKQSALLKGLRSMEIPFPERGVRFSFKKLGGAPHVTLSYRKKGLIAKPLYLLLLFVVLLAPLKFRRLRLPLEKFLGFFRGKSIREWARVLTRSRVLRLVPTLMMICSVVAGIPWFIMGLGLNTALLLVHLSRKRYEKKGVAPSYNYKIFFKYLPSYIILASSVLYIFCFFHPVFLVSLAGATLLNIVLVSVYAVVHLFTKRKPAAAPDDDEGEGKKETPAPVTDDKEAEGESEKKEEPAPGTDDKEAEGESEKKEEPAPGTDDKEVEGEDVKKETPASVTDDKEDKGERVK